MTSMTGKAPNGRDVESGCASDKHEIGLVILWQGQSRPLEKNLMAESQGHYLPNNLQTRGRAGNNNNNNKKEEKACLSKVTLYGSLTGSYQYIRASKRDTSSPRACTRQDQFRVNFV